jgi:signal transduction histidine kinase
VNFAPYIPLAGFFINIFFALFVFSRAPRAAANRVFLLLGLSIATWNLGSYFLLIVTQREEALFWARFLQFGCIFGVVAFFHLALLIAGFRVGRWIGWLYGLEVILAATNLTPLFIRDVRMLGESGWYAIAGPAFHVFNIPFSLMFGSIFVLLKRYRTLSPIQRSRLLPIIWAEIGLSVFGANDVLPIIGIEHYPFTNIQVYPWGSLAAVFYGIVVAYSVLHFELLNMQVGLSRFAAHFIRFAFLFSITVGLLLLAVVATGAFTEKSFAMALGVFVVSAITASLLFPRLFGGSGVETWERRILGDRFEYQDRVRSFIENMGWYHDLSPLFNDLHDLLVQVFQLGSYQIILRDETTRAFTLFRAYPDQPQQQIADLRSESPIFRVFEWRKTAYLAFDPDRAHSAHNSIELQAQRQLGKFGASFCFPLSSQNEPFGLLLVGGKVTNEPLTATDINLLVTLVKNMSLMVNQIRLKNQILQTQELDLLGRMSRGMAHDLNNLLTPVWTLLQLSHEMTSAGGPATFDEELLPSALRNIRIMRSYITEALFFSENLRPDFQLGRLDVLVTQAAELARSSRKKAIEVKINVREEILAEVDEVLLQRLVANIISNAIDASPPSATIRVELERLAKTESQRDWLRIRVIDQGEGIRKEDLNRVFAPYYTTKTRGDEARGFGLGLAICRKIINLHGGNLSIQSQVKQGTTVQIDLPSRQLRPETVSLASSS